MEDSQNIGFISNIWTEAQLPKEYREHEIFKNIDSIDGFYDFLSLLIRLDFHPKAFLEYFLILTHVFLVR